MAPRLQTVHTITELHRASLAWRRAGQRIGLVPTMGALHRGHMALVYRALADCDKVITTIFVNPPQFSPGEDLASYPRDEAGDARVLADAGVDLVFIPDEGEIYPSGFATQVSVAGLTEGLCGAHRPGHFDGVATVVCKLLMEAVPDAAYFGEKDYQQLQMIRRMVADLDIAAEILAVPTVREDDGLALSTRNAYLSTDQRRIAPALFRTITRIADRFGGGDFEARALEAEGAEALNQAGFDGVDYVAICDARTLEPVSGPGAPARVLVAARLGKTRLIDNVAVADGDT
ncbi:MAG: pantoate--beta-alanine ligase [Alphaproteobacteria bacterium]